jgi:acyl carrier protein
MIVWRRCWPQSLVRAMPISLPDLARGKVGALDSLRQTDLVVSLEREYGISLQIPDMRRMASVDVTIKVLRDKGVELEN